MNKLDRLRDFLARELNVPHRDLTASTRLDELISDSLGQAELIMALEEADWLFNSELQDALHMDWRGLTLKELAEHLV